MVKDNIHPELRWEKVSDTQCYEAVDPLNDTLYTINVITGAVLFDGRPQGRLPATITGTALYARTFGTRNFEVTYVAGKFESNKKVHGRHYHFFRDHDSNLIIHEVDGDVVLELMEHQDIPNWGKDIPVRLQRMFSHWCCRNTSDDCIGTILFRGEKFSDRDVSFLLHRQGGTWVCARVPEHQRHLSWHAELLPQIDKEHFDQLVLLKHHDSCPIINRLNKFEPRQDCIHVFKVHSVYAL